MESIGTASAISKCGIDGSNLVPSTSKLSNGFLSFSPAAVSGNTPATSTSGNSPPKIVSGDDGYVLEDVPHFSDYIPNPPVCSVLSLHKVESMYV